MAAAKRKTSPILGRTERKRQRLSQEEDAFQGVRPRDRTKRSKPDPESSTVGGRRSTTLVTSQEPPAFPRGGGSILTPIERKQIQAQAAKDVLFEMQDQDQGQDQDQESFENEEVDKTGMASSRRKGGKSKLKKSQVQEKDRPSGVRVESLTYKRITSGSILLGQIEAVSSRDITMALPNNLTGYVPLTAVSAQFTERLEKLLNQTDDNASVASSTGDTEINLRNYFRKGQFLRTYVTSTLAEPVDGGRADKKRMELSIEPSLCNLGISVSDLVVHNTIQASVISVEDHGAIMDLDIGSARVRGFLPTKELGEDLQMENLEPGMVLLCLIIGEASDGRTFKLSADRQKLGSIESSNFLSSAPTVNALLPGTAVEILVSNAAENGLVGQVMGMLDVTADLVHSGLCRSNAELPKHSPGTKIKGRLICTFPLSERTKLGFSLLENVIQMLRSDDIQSNRGDSIRLHISSIIPNFHVVRVEPGFGLFASIGRDNAIAFLHISRLEDEKVDSISSSTGHYKVGSKHRGRITGYNSMDNLFLASFQTSVIEQPFLYIEDVKIGQQTTGKVEKLIYRNSEVSGILLSLAEGISGFVPRMHLSDAHLHNPEKKFKEGTIVKARVLFKSVEKRQIRLTLKKALVNSETKLWKEFADVAVGKSSLGILTRVEPQGAVVQFLGDVKGYLPVSEMSEAFIKDATQHFRAGQVIMVTALGIDHDSRRLTLTCKDPESLGQDRQEALLALQPGSLVSGKVFEKHEDDLLLNLEGNNAVGRLEIGFVTDGSLNKRQSAMHKIRAGQTLRDLLVVQVLPKQKLARLCNRPSLIQAAKDRQFPKSFEDLREGMNVKGFVTNITEAGIFVGFAAGLTGLLPRSQLPPEISGLPQFGMSFLQTVSATVHSVSSVEKVSRFWLTMKPQDHAISKRSVTVAKDRTTVHDPVDHKSAFVDEFNIGYKTMARIVSVKATQINVELSKEVHGRIDVSEVFDDWKSIKDKRKPLKNYRPKQILPVRVLGIHDARNHRFLPISHRSGRSPVFELSAKPSFVNSKDLDILSLEKIELKSSWLAFVNNVSQDCLWVNITPNVRGRVKAIDASDDVSQLTNIATNFPIGSAVRVRVLRVDAGKKQLDLSAKQEDSSALADYKDVPEGAVLPGRVTRSSERQVLVQLNENLVGAVDLINMADDFIKADPAKFDKSDIIRVYVAEVDPPNKKIMLSTRPSKVLSSSLPITDPEITSIEQIQLNAICRGFVSNVADNGLFVVLGRNVTAYVRISELSDAYLKDWKEHFVRDQLVRGRVTSVDKASNRVQLSLKESVLKPDYKSPVTFDGLSVGQIVTGKVAKVENFGVFILVDNSSNVRGLCHRSEIAESRIEDVRPLYNEGDLVKAKILKIDPQNRRINFGLKASYFKDEEVTFGSDTDGLAKLQDLAEADEDQPMEPTGSSNQDGRSSDEEDGGMIVDDQHDVNEEIFENSVGPGRLTDGKVNGEGLETDGFDWTGISIPSLKRTTTHPTDSHAAKKSKQKHVPRASPHLDQIGDLDANGPRSIDDYERLLLGEPDSSVLWLQYMAFELQVGEIDSARQIGERALKTISIGRDDEKLNVWVGLLNLENTYGDDGSVQEVFRRACEYNDPQEIHNRLTSILIQSGKHEVSEFSSRIDYVLTERCTESRRILSDNAQEVFARP